LCKADFTNILRDTSADPHRESAAAARRLGGSAVGIVLLRYLNGPSLLVVGAFVALLAASWLVGFCVNRSHPHG